jgi:hypothetical protein
MAVEAPSLPELAASLVSQSDPIAKVCARSGDGFSTPLNGAPHAENAVHIPPETHRHARRHRCASAGPTRAARGPSALADTARAQVLRDKSVLLAHEAAYNLGQVRPASPLPRPTMAWSDAGRPRVSVSHGGPGGYVGEARSGSRASTHRVDFRSRFTASSGTKRRRR